MVAKRRLSNLWLQFLAANLILFCRPALAAAPLSATGDIESTLCFSWHGDTGPENGCKGQFDWTQRIRLDLAGELTPGLSIEGKLDNLSEASQQNLTLTLTRGSWQFNVGDFQFQPVSLLVDNVASLKGIKAAGAIGPARLSLAMAIAQGSPAAKEFVGRSGVEKIVYRRAAPYNPNRVGAQLEADIAGVFHFDLPFELDPAFAGIYVVWDDDISACHTLLATFTAHNLAVLLNGSATTQGVLTPGEAVSLDSNEYILPTGNPALLALAQEPDSIVRRQLQALIGRYNKENSLAEGERLAYPYLPDSEQDKAMLAELVAHHTGLWASAAAEAAGKIRLAALGAGRRDRYYLLGQRDVEPDSVAIVLMMKDGKQIPADEAPALTPEIYYEEGLLDLGPGWQSIMADVEKVAVDYRYQAAEFFYVIGPGIIPGSDRVYLNDHVLARDVDYTIDYESGILTPLTTIQPDDKVRVEYETYRGVLGGTANYQRRLYSGQVELTPWPGLKLGLHLLQGADVPTTSTDSDTLSTMPNTHTVAGFQAYLDRKPWTVALHLASSQNVFPFDDNQRLLAPNQINALAGGQDWPAYLAVAHQNGLTVWLPSGGTLALAGNGEWHNYDSSKGLAGVPVYDIKVYENHWYLATQGGLTVVSTDYTCAGFALDEAGRWHRFAKYGALPSGPAYAVAVYTDRLWLGTDHGLISTPLPPLLAGAPEWRQESAGVGETISVIEVALRQNGAEALYVGGAQGLTVLGGDGAFHVLLPDVPVTAIAVAADMIYAGGRTGLYKVDASGQVQRLSSTLAVYDLLVQDHTLYIAAENGLWLLDLATPSSELIPAAGMTMPVKSLALGPGEVAGGAPALWAGAGKHRENDTALWQVDPFMVWPLATVPFSAAGIPAEDANHYVDISGAEHTYTGAAGVLQIERQIGPGNVYFTASRYEPGYLALDATKRQDLQTWAVGGRALIGEAIKLAASHSEEYSRTLSLDAAGALLQPVRLWQECGVLTWTRQPVTTVEYKMTHRDDEATPGSDSRETVVTAQTKYAALAGAATIDAGLQYNDFDHLYNPAEDRQTVVYSTKMNVKIRGLYAYLDYRDSRNTKNTAMSSWTQSANSGVQWQAQIQGWQVGLDYNERLALEKIPAESAGRTSTGRLSLQKTAWSIGKLTGAPNLYFNWQEMAASKLTDRTQTQVGGAFIMQGLAWSARANADAVHLVYAYNGKQEDSLRSGFSLQLPGIAALVPSLDWNLTQKLVSNPVYGRRRYLEQRLVVSLQWQPVPAVNGTITFTCSIRQDADQSATDSVVNGQMSFANEINSYTIQWEAGRGDPSLADSDAELTATLYSRVKLEFSASRQIASRWQVTATLTGVWNEAMPTSTSASIGFSLKYQF